MSINSAGSVSVRGYGATVSSYSPRSFSTSYSSQRRSVRVNFVIPSGYSNSGRTFSKTYTATQPAKARPAFNTSAAGASVSINSAGSVSVRGYGATVSSYSPRSFSNSYSSQRRSVRVSFVVPSGYSNSGRTFSKSYAAIQPAKARPAFNTASFNARVSINSDGRVSASGSNISGYSPSTFSSSYYAQNRSVQVSFRVPSGYSNSGRTFSKTYSATQPAKARPAFNTASFNARVSINSDGRVSASGSNISGYSPSTFSSSYYAQNRSVQVSFRVPSGYSNSGQLFSKSYAATQPAKARPLYTYYRDAMATAMAIPVLLPVLPPNPQAMSPIAAIVTMGIAL